MISGSSKASNVMKMDMVKPMPPKNPAPTICLQEISLDNWDRRVFTAKKPARKMPNGLPKNKPAKTPKLLGAARPSNHLPLNDIPVFASAKTGMIMKATGLCRKCCSLYDGDFSLPSPNGRANASRTPANVAWTPDCNIKYHIKTPGIR